MGHENYFGRVNHEGGTVTYFCPYNGGVEEEASIKSPAGGGLPLVTEEQVLDAITSLKLPFEGKLSRIVGWGGFSVAGRNGKNVLVCKPIPDDLKIPIEDDIKVNKQVRQLFEDEYKKYLNPSFGGVITGGPDRQRFFVKVSREVPGVTLTEIPTISMLTDEALNQEVMAFYLSVINSFLKTGMMPELEGDTYGWSKWRNFYKHLRPWDANNVVVDALKPLIKIVDFTTIPRTVSFNQATFLRKGFMVLKLAGLVGMTGTLKLANSMGKIRKRVMRERPPDKIECQNFKNGFVKVIDGLKESAIDYRVVGSFALAGHLAAKDHSFELKPRRPDKTIRDIDVLCITNKEKLGKLEEYFGDLMKQNPGFPEVSLHPFPDTNNCFQVRSLGRELMSANEVLSDGKLGIKFGDLSLPFSDSDLEPIEVNLWGTNFKTVSPETLLGLYLTRQGWFKVKDMDKLRLLADICDAKIPAKYYDFVKKINAKYPEVVRNHILADQMNYLTHGFAGKVYRNLKLWLTKSEVKQVLELAQKEV